MDMLQVYFTYFTTLRVDVLQVLIYFTFLNLFIFYFLFTLLHRLALRVDVLQVLIHLAFIMYVVGLF